MTLTGLHLLLTYQCNFECDHCFVWGSPWQSGTMTSQDIARILKQAQELKTVEWIYFEGGEPFLYYPVLVAGVRSAADAGFKVGLVSNAYWATDVADAITWLKPFAGLISDLTTSSDLYHQDENMTHRAEVIREAAEHLGLPLGVITIAQPEAADIGSAVGQIPKGQIAVMYRGRAAEELAARTQHRSWLKFTECPHEDLREPGRVHIDPLGNLHICQGISLGNIFETPLVEICRQFNPDGHPITGPLLAGGPAELVRRHDAAHEEHYADACHLCYETRVALRERLPDILRPDQMYGVFDD